MKNPVAYYYRYAATHASNVPVTDNTTAADLYCSYFIDEVWVLLFTETNRYAQANLSDKPSAHAWTGVTVEEMKAFGLLIIMGIVKLPQLTMYWQRSNHLISICGIGDVMPRTQSFGYIKMEGKEISFRFFM